MKVKYIAVILLSTQLVYTACDDMGFLQIKPDSLELTDDRIKTVDDLENLLLGAYNGYVLRAFGEAGRCVVLM